MKILHYALLFAIAASISSCFRFTDCTRGEGEVTERIIDLPPFTGVESSVSADIDFTYDSTQSVTLSGQANILDLLELGVSGGRLKIDTKHNVCFRDVEGLKVKIHLPLITYVGIDGSGDVYSTNRFPKQGNIEFVVNGSSEVDMKLEAQKVDFSLDGSGTVRFEGFANELNYTCNGSGDLKCFDLLTHITKIDINGSGNAEVRADSILETSVNGSGDIYYKGVPPSKSEFNGSGSLHRSN